MAAGAGPDVERVRDWLRDAHRITVLTGAGISTDSGIPDFRGPQGLWTKDPSAQRMSTLDDYLSDRDVRVRAWQQRLSHPAWTAEPNAGHRALVALEHSGRLERLVTQNIDGLHQRAGSSPHVVLEVHGSVWHARCMSCPVRMPMADVLDRVRAAEEDPRCRRCGGILKSTTISFGEPLDEAVLRHAVAAAASCEVFLAVGTSLAVYPAASLPRLALDAGARLAVVNAQPTPYDEVAAAVLREPIGAVLPRLVA